MVAQGGIKTLGQTCIRLVLLLAIFIAKHIIMQPAFIAFGFHTCMHNFLTIDALKKKNFLTIDHPTIWLKALS